MPISDIISAATIQDTFITSNPYLTDAKKKTIDYIVNNWDEISERIWDAEARKEHEELVAKQKINKYYRNLVKHVHWSGNTCIVYWNDGTQTKSHWNALEAFDPEKAILVCMARKLFGNTNIYNEVIQKYEGDGWDHYDNENLAYQEFIKAETKDLNDIDIDSILARFAVGDD